MGAAEVKVLNEICITDRRIWRPECGHSIESFTASLYWQERAKSKKLVKALKFYAAKGPLHPRGGDTAREAIAEYERDE